MTVCAVVSCLGTLNGTLVLAAELPATMARSGVLPEWFGRGNELGAPVNAAWLGAAVSSGFVLLTAARGGVAAFEILSLVTTVTSLFLYVAAALAAGRFSRDGRLQTRPSLWFAISGALGFGAIALGGCGTEAMIWGIGLLAVGWPLRYWAESESRRRKPAQCRDGAAVLYFVGRRVVMRSSRPLIGVTAEVDPHARDPSVLLYRRGAPLVEAVSRAGGLPVILPHHLDDVPALLDAFDGFVIGGGAHQFQDPARLFGDEPATSGPSHKRRRTSFETAIIAGSL